MLNWLFALLEYLPEWALMLSFFGFLIVGMAFLIKGADLFVLSASSIAKILGVSALIIGLTIVSFGTSAPEASVSIFSQLNGSSDISFGNVVGSNIFNSMVVLGASAIYAPIMIHISLIRREIPLMIFSTILLLGLALFFGYLGHYALLQLEGAVLLLVFIWYLYMNYKASKESNSDLTEVVEEIPEHSMKYSITFLLIGLIMIILGGEMVVHGAKNIALQIGVSEALVGLSIVAIGTSLPELVTSVVAAKKNENDIALGNVIGSNIFNLLFIIGMSASIGVMPITSNAIIDLLVLLGLSLFVVYTILIHKKITKTYGIIFICLYIAYIAFIIVREIGGSVS